MSRTISQLELGEEIAQALEQGEAFIVIRDGVPIGELKPLRRAFVNRAAVLARLRGTPPLDALRFRDDVDNILDQDAEPRT
jgi:antitoxin (DNA-binding transcriptional repressor) of toxin-antitoxin stability system